MQLWCSERLYADVLAEVRSEIITSPCLSELFDRGLCVSSNDSDVSFAELDDCTDDSYALSVTREMCDSESAACAVYRISEPFFQYHLPNLSLLYMDRPHFRMPAVLREYIYLCVRFSLVVELSEVRTE